MRLRFHRLEQWDLDCWPLICIHLETRYACTRLFCVWLWGISCIDWRGLKQLWRDRRKP